MAPPTKAQKLVIEARRRDVAQLYCQGHHQADIARRFKVDPKTISNDLAAVREEWLASRVESFGLLQATELAKLGELERVFWAAWVRSCENEEASGEATTTGRVGKEGEDLPDLVKTFKTSKGQAGDPRFLAGVLDCVKRRCEIRGLDAAVKNEHSGPGGGAIPVTMVEIIVPAPAAGGAETEAEAGEGG